MKNIHIDFILITIDKDNFLKILNNTDIQSSDKIEYTDNRKKHT